MNAIAEQNRGLTPERVEVVSALARVPEGLTPRDLAGFIGKDRAAIRKTLQRMQNAGQVQKGEGGRYLPLSQGGPEREASPVTEIAGGVTGKAGGVTDEATPVTGGGPVTGGVTEANDRPAPVTGPNEGQIEHVIRLLDEDNDPAYARRYMTRLYGLQAWPPDLIAKLEAGEAKGGIPWDPLRGRMPDGTYFLLGDSQRGYREHRAKGKHMNQEQEHNAANGGDGDPQDGDHLQGPPGSPDQDPPAPDEQILRRGLRGGNDRGRQGSVSFDIWETGDLWNRR